MLLVKGICSTEVPHREIEEYLLAMIYHVGNYSGKKFRSDLTSIWMFAWGEYFRNFWVGMCRWELGTLNLYQS